MKIHVSWLHREEEWQGRAGQVHLLLGKQPSHLQGPAVRRKGLVGIVHVPLSIWQCSVICEHYKKLLSAAMTLTAGHAAHCSLFGDQSRSGGAINKSALKQLMFYSTVSSAEDLCTAVVNLGHTEHSQM